MDKEFAMVFSTFKNDIFRLVYSYTKNKYDADDITQDVFIKLYNNFDKFESNEHIKKWLIKVAINKCKDHFLSAWKRKIFFMSNNLENNISTSIEQDSLYEPVFSLPKKYRVVIHLYYYEGYKIKEISNILNEKETTIQTRLSRARIKLKEMIEGGIENEEKI